MVAPLTLLIPSETWAAQRDDFCTVTGTDADPTRQMQRLDAELHAAASDLERVLADPTSKGLARIDEDGDLIVSPLPAERFPPKPRRSRSQSPHACRRYICPPCS